MTVGSTDKAKSISDSVEVAPQEKRREDCAVTSVWPIASKTWLGRCTPALQAAPVEQETFSESINKRSESLCVPGKVTLVIPGKRGASTPFI